MLTLSVPVPPSETSYQTIIYTFSYNGNSANINQVVANSGSDKGTYAYRVSLTYSEDVDGVKDNGNKLIEKNGSKYYYGTTELISLANVNDDCEDDDQRLDIAGVLSAVNARLEKNGEAKVSNSSDIMVAVKGTTTNPTYTYFLKRDLSSQEGTASTPAYTEQTYAEYHQTVISANITRDANNRISAISFKNNDDVTVSSSTILDSAAYDDAYNEYEYQTYLYQQEMEAINAQTSVIQAQDKKLELRLKQLDTEQNAISTEMESCSSIVEKNIEDTFKIFA